MSEVFLGCAVYSMVLKIWNCRRTVIADVLYSSKFVYMRIAYITTTTNNLYYG
jgi:hypothetical protein